MVFRREHKVDAFQRQMGALRQQLGGNPLEEAEEAQMPELQDERRGARYGTEPAADAGGYSFGDYAQPQGDLVPAGDEQPPMPEVPAIDSQVSVIAKDTFWKGELDSDGSMHVHGRVEGTLRAKEDIWVAEGAEVNATITARRVVVGGNVTGTIHASDRFEALPHGNIGADVEAPTFVVHEGATINGQLRMGGGEQGAEARGASPAIIQRRSARPGA